MRKLLSMSLCTAVPVLKWGEGSSFYRFLHKVDCLFTGIKIG